MGFKLALTPCLGILCPLALQCVRYDHIHHATVPSARWWATCAVRLSDKTEMRPAFISVDFIGPIHPDGYHESASSKEGTYATI